jgi:hypothetical protein
MKKLVETKVPMIDNWAITNRGGNFLRIEENSNRDMWITGEVETHEGTFTPLKRKYKLVGYAHGYISFVYDDKELHTFFLGNPSKKYSGATGMTTMHFCECMVAKLNGLS